MKMTLLRPFAVALLGAALTCPVFAAVDVEPYEQLIAQGKPDQAMAMLAKELERHPTLPKLLYDYGVAAYAAGRYDEALLSFDKVEANSRSTSLVEKARKQKGNAEFHLGEKAKADNLDETIERWKTSLGHYKMALKDSPSDPMAKNNHDYVEKLLMDILLKAAQKHMEQAHQEWMKGDPKIEELRKAMEKFQEAKRVDEQNQQAQQGEKQAREELAQELAKQGEKQAQRPDQVNERTLKEMEKGVNKLEDANRLVPENKPIEQKLDQAKQNLADALTQMAKQQLEQAKDKGDKEKFNKLEKAMDNAQKALDQKPEHQEAQKTLEEAKNELAKAHEERGDKEMAQAEHAPLQKAANQLENALEDFKQAEALKPQDPNLVAKEQKAQNKLEDALQKLADKNMQAQPNEKLDEKAGRLETAEQALQDLEQLKPAEKTEQQLADAQKQLAETREEIAALARKDHPQQPQDPKQPKPPQNATKDPPPDFEKMPHLTQQPMGKGDFKSDNMNKKGKDY